MSVRGFAFIGMLCLVVGALGCQSGWLARGDQPDWVDAPAQPESQSEFLSAVGVAEAEGDPEPARELADLGARDELRDAISDYTRRAVTGFFNANRQYPPPSSPLSGELVDILRTEVAANILRLAMREKTWEAPGGRVYVLYRVPIALVHTEISQRARDAVVYVNPFGAAADQAVVELDRHLAALVSERLKETTRKRPPSETTPPEERTPEWLETGHHKNFPTDKYYSAIGLGKDLPAAEASARAEMAFRLNSQMDRLIPRLPSIPAAESLAKDLQWLDVGALGFTEDDLSIARIAERWHDPVTSTHYTLAVLEPSSAALVLRDRITAARDAAQGLLASARNHQRAENYAVSLREYGEAVVTAGQAVVVQAKAAAMAPREMDEILGLVTEPLLDQACEGARSLLAGFRLNVVDGDRQWLHPSRPPGQAFAVKASAGDPLGPAEGLPVLFLHRETGREFGGATTDAAGLARWTVADPLPPEPLSGAVVARLDLEAAGLPVEAARLSSPEVEFDYVVRSTANTRLVLLLRGSVGGERLPAKMAADAVEDALMHAGFQFVSNDEVLQHVPAVELTPESDDRAVREAFASLRASLGQYRCLLVVIGELQPHVAETSPVDEGKLFFARCPWRFRAVDMDLPGDDHTVLDISGTAAAAYLGDEVEALRRARTEGRQQAAAQLAEALRAKFQED
jgi:hypothetical protein